MAVHIQIDGNRVMIMHPMKHCKMMDATITEEDPFCNEIEELTTDRWCLMNHIRIGFMARGAR